MTKTGIELIANERKEQVEKHGWTPEHDVMHEKDGSLRELACALCSIDATFALPWGECRDIQTHLEGAAEQILSKPYVERLVIAGALIAAEIDRMQIVMASEEFQDYRTEVINGLRSRGFKETPTCHEDAIFVMFDGGMSIGYCIGEICELSEA